MAKEQYELLALFMRYWFVFLIVMIVWRAMRQMLKERHQHKKILKSLPDAGLVGEIVDTKTNEAYPLPREGYISSKASADIRLKNLSKKNELHFEFLESKGIQVIPVGRRSFALLDGEPVKNKPYAMHGTYLEVGSYVLRFRLFEGLKVPQRTPKIKENIQEYNMALENTWTFAVEPPQYDADTAYNMQSDVQHIYPEDYLIQHDQHNTIEYGENFPYEQEERFDDGSYFKPVNYGYDMRKSNDSLTQWQHPHETGGSLSQEQYPQENQNEEQNDG